MVNHDHGDPTAGRRQRPADEEFRAPSKGRWVSLPLAMFIVAALVIMMTLAHHFIWLGLLPLACAGLCVASGIQLRRARGRQQVTWFGLWQLATAVGALALLFVVR
ncbi:MAG: hypothetical protein ACRDRL_05985 [Sciscionella sp.]